MGDAAMVPDRARRVTVYDVAARAGVSIATVSFAFRRPDEVRAATREAVLTAARELGYAPSGSARGLVSRRTGSLGLHSFDMLIERPQDEEAPEGAAVDADLDLSADTLPWAALGDDVHSDPLAYPLYVDEIQRGFELEARRRGHNVLLSSGGRSTADVADTAGRVDGLAVFPSIVARESLAHITQTIPVVLFSSPIASADGYHRVLVDNVQGMQDLVAHLVQDHQITDLAFVGGPAAADYAERFAGMQSAMRRFGLTPASEPLDSSLLGDTRPLARVRELAIAGALPRALICASDQLALFTFEILRSVGSRVPEDVVVTGFDGVLASRLSVPRLTTVRQPMEAMGRVAAQLLANAAGAPPQMPRTLRLGTQLRIGQSCGCP
ncbi:LacI family transcriptional regulator [Microbacterium halimionae]|uniref:LacI family transcriptional regulator n=1 Tax=Microbacterium halimionae TaxID=1526413 RepID=A0A7W3PM91_9MICO|nr:LacI family DNA-binding transcriptional regulator [Microbacterium halimionae]MBA8816747.1 LacI family transcriptional regulator [Microbacterium halimionae]NII94957.1 LacI family transcriptional regulator [Microbacterium halimionae]